MNHKEFSSRGGKTRAKKLSKKQRTEIARMGGKAGGGNRTSAH
jgi:general stress protein YciG